MSQWVAPDNPLKNTQFEDCAAPGAADETQNTPIDPDLQTIIERLPSLSEAARASIVKLVNGGL